MVLNEHKAGLPFPTLKKHTKIVSRKLVKLENNKIYIDTLDNLVDGEGVIFYIYTYIYIIYQSIA